MNTVITDNVSDTNTVTHTLRNSHCIICGIPFKTARFAKLYCSAKCKQFGYNHKEKINQTGHVSGTGINATPQIFLIDEFQFYDKRQKMLKRFKELTKKKSEWEVTESEITMSNRIGIQASGHTWEKYTKRLTENEESEFYDLETDIEDELKLLTLKELSIEQWSFIKSLYLSFDEISLCEMIASLSKDFYSQLNLSPANSDTNSNVIIKNKYVNHCNLIATGVIKFEKKPVSNDTKNQESGTV